MTGIFIYLLLIILCLPLTKLEAYVPCKNNQTLSSSSGCDSSYQKCVHGKWLKASCSSGHRFDTSINRCLSCPDSKKRQRVIRETLYKYFKCVPLQVEGRPRQGLYYYNSDGSSFTFTIFGKRLPRPNAMTEWMEENKKNYDVEPIPYRDPIFSTTSTTTTTTTTTMRPPTKHYLELQKSGEKITWRDIIPQTNCGSWGPQLFSILRPFEAGSKVHAGLQTHIQDYPWQVALVNTGVGIPISIRCGGTIIGDRFIISAAHCFRTEASFSLRGETFSAYTKMDLNLIEVRAGATDFMLSPQIFKIGSLFAHPYFHETHHRNDIALVIINGRFTWTPEVYPACLPTRESEEEYYPGRRTRISGWGRKNYEVSDPSTILHGGWVKISSYDYCTKENKKYHNITEGMFCANDVTANGDYIDTCIGDSGGPLVSYSNKRGKMVLLGITAFGKGCGKKDLPGVYTKVTSYLEWIHQRVEVAVGAGYGSREKLPIPKDVGGTSL